MDCNAAHTLQSLSTQTQSGVAWNSTLVKLQTLWEGHQARSRKSRAMATFSEIDVHTLRDIGAPNWIIAEASLRGDSRGLRLIDLYRS